MNFQAPDHRRKWNLDEYEQLAAKRLEKDDESHDGEPGPRRESLKQRDYQVDLDSRLGKSVVSMYFKIMIPII